VSLIDHSDGDAGLRNADVFILWIPWQRHKFLNLTPVPQPIVRRITDTIRFDVTTVRFVFRNTRIQDTSCLYVHTVYCYCSTPAE
jgi:hypothetical protein